MNDLFTRSWQKPTRLDSDPRLQDLEVGMGATSQGTEEFSAQEFAAFNSKSRVIEQEIKAAGSSIDRMQTLYEVSKSTILASEVHRIREQMQGDVEKISSAAKSIKSKLEQLVRENEENTRKPGCEKNSAIGRHRANVTWGLGNKLRDVVERFKALRSKMDAEYRETVERRVYTVTGTKPNPDEVDQLIETGKSEEIFQRAVKSQGRTTALAAIAEMQERHDAVKELTKNLVLLHQIFQDMAVLVESQGELVDNIEHNVNIATDYTKHGVTKLQDAVVIQSNTRKWQFYACIVCSVIVVVLIIVLLPTVLALKNSS